jgi:K(+)-stimulated pyrophosphate-energized sodium pump
VDFLILDGFTLVESIALWVLLVVGLLVSGYALLLRRQIARRDQGSERMQEVWGWLKAGADAQQGQYTRTIMLLAIVLALLLAASGYFGPVNPQTLDAFGSDDALLWTAVARGGGALAGALLAALVGLLGIRTTLTSNIRAAAAASKGYPQSLTVAYRAGMVPGLLAAGLGLLASTAAYILLLEYALLVDVWLGVAAGTALAALVLRAGGGIYAQAASTGSEIVSSGEDALPADDPANPAVVADLLGDTGSDGGGMAADLFAATELAFLVALLAGLLLGGGTTVLNADANGEAAVASIYLLFPLLLRGIGALAALIGGLLVRTDERRRNARAAINRGFFTAAVLAALGFAGLSYYLIEVEGLLLDWRPLLAALTGVVLLVALGRVSELFTSPQYGTVKAVSRSAQYGSSSSVVAGLAAGFAGALWLVLVFVLGVVAAAATTFESLEAVQAGISEPTEAIAYALALAGIGVVSIAANVSAMNGYAASAHSAARVGLRCGLDKNPRNVVEDLDAVGSTTRFLSRGIASGITALIVIAFAATLLTFTDVGLAFVLSLLLGAVVPLMGLMLVLYATDRVTANTVNTTRQQVQQETPDHARIASSAGGAVQADMFALTLLAVLLPVATVLLLGAAAAGGLIIGLVLTGLPLALFLGGAGGAWDSARTYIEDGFFGGKRSPAHQVATQTALVGQPLRALAGPVLDPLVKLTALAAVLIMLAPRTDLVINAAVAGVGVVVLLVVLVRSRRQVEIKTAAVKKATAPVKTSSKARSRGS